jgi:hypothetical protein
MRSSWLAADLGVQFDVRMYSGLCITIPPRVLKRKLHDVEADGNVAEQPKVGILDLGLVLGLTIRTAFPQDPVERISKAMNGQIPDISRTLSMDITLYHPRTFMHPAHFWTLFCTLPCPVY